MRTCTWVWVCVGEGGSRNDLGWNPSETWEPREGKSFSFAQHVLAPEKDEENSARISFYCKGQGTRFPAHPPTPPPVSGHMQFALKTHMELPLPFDLHSLPKDLGPGPLLTGTTWFFIF